MSKILEMIKAASKSAKPTQKIKGKDLYSGGVSSGTSNSHCQGGGGW